MNINYQKFQPQDLWILEKTKSVLAENMVLKFKKIDGGKKLGFGIYALSYIHSNGDECVIYVGKFSGKMSRNGSIDNAMDGDARERWFKHIGTASLLLADLRMNSKDAFTLHQKKTKSFYKNDVKFSQCLEKSILGLESEKLEKIFFKENGNQISDNRLGFAIQNLIDTNSLDDLNLASLNTIISKFNIHYWQISFDKPIRKSQVEPLIEGTKNEPGVEKIVISKYKQKLPMNNEFLPENENFYHYDVKKLINIYSSDFTTLSRFIHEQIRLKFSNLVIED